MGEKDLIKYVKDVLLCYVFKIIMKCNMDVNIGDDCFVCDILYLF